MKANTASANDCTMESDCVMKRNRRLSERSATAPAQAERKNTGPYWQAAKIPIARPFSVRLRTSSVSATLVNQLPVLEIRLPIKKSRKFRLRSERKVVRKPEPARPEKLIDGFQ